MTDIDPETITAELDQRLADRIANAVARRDKQHRIRATLAERRTAGKRRLHEQRLADTEQKEQ